MRASSGGCGGVCPVMASNPLEEMVPSPLKRFAGWVRVPVNDDHVTRRSWGRWDSPSVGFCPVGTTESLLTSFSSVVVVGVVDCGDGSEQLSL